MPLDVVYTKSYNIWSDINPFLRQLAEGYAKSQQTKWDNEWQLSAIADIEKANKPQEVNSFLEMQKIPKENLDLEGFKGFADEAMGMLAKKEMTINPEDFETKPGAKPTITTPTQTKIMPDVKEFNELYKYVSELPTGKVDWTDTLNVFKKKLESGRAVGSAGQQFLQMIMGQSMPTNQRQKVQQDFEFTKDIKETLYPETVKKAPNTELEYWLREHPGQGVEDYWRAKDKPEQVFDWEKFLEENPDWRVDTVDSKGTVRIKRKDTTKRWDFDTYEEAEQWTNTHKQPGYQWKIDPQPKGFNVSAEKVPVTPQGGTKKLIPTYDIINKVRQDLYLNPGERDSILNNFNIKYNTEGVDLPSIADVAKFTYSGAEQEITNPENEFIDEKGVVKDEFAYRDFYADYEQYAKQYFKETGQILPKEYLSLEEAGKYTSLTRGTGYKGGYKPVLNTENIPWSWQKDVDPTQEFYNEMQRTGTDIEDVDLEKLDKKTEVDVDKLLKMCSP